MIVNLEKKIKLGGGNKKGGNQISGNNVLDDSLSQVSSMMT